MAILSPLGNLFGRSPIGPIQEHMALADTAAHLVPDLFRATAADDWDQAGQVHKDIVAAEAAVSRRHHRDMSHHAPKDRSRFARRGSSVCGNIPSSLFLLYPARPYARLLSRFRALLKTK